LLLLFCFSLFTSNAWAQNTPPGASDADLLEEKLQRIDEKGQSQGRRTFQIRATSSVVRPKNNYALYQRLAAGLVAKLLRIKAENDQQSTPYSYSLQRLAAITHSVTVENQALHVALEGEETRYQSYQKILQAVTSLEEATQYWRQTNEAQSLGRGSRQEANQDQEIVRLKLQNAMGAIETLKEFEALKMTLDQNVRE
jgi:hypothetical protein